MSKLIRSEDGNYYALFMSEKEARIVRSLLGILPIDDMNGESLYRTMRTILPYRVDLSKATSDRCVVIDYDTAS